MNYRLRNLIAQTNGVMGWVLFSLDFAIGLAMISEKTMQYWANIAPLYANRETFYSSTGHYGKRYWGIFMFAYWFYYYATQHWFWSHFLDVLERLGWFADDRYPNLKRCNTHFYGDEGGTMWILFFLLTVESDYFFDDFPLALLNQTTFDYEFANANVAYINSLNNSSSFNNSSLLNDTLSGGVGNNDTDSLGMPSPATLFFVLGMLNFFVSISDLHLAYFGVYTVVLGLTVVAEARGGTFGSHGNVISQVFAISYLLVLLPVKLCFDCNDTRLGTCCATQAGDPRGWQSVIVAFFLTTFFTTYMQVVFCVKFLFGKRAEGYSTCGQHFLHSFDDVYGVLARSCIVARSEALCQAGAHPGCGGGCCLSKPSSRELSTSTASASHTCNNTAVGVPAVVQAAPTGKRPAKKVGLGKVGEKALV
jgi:hypothetical protein